LVIMDAILLQEFENVIRYGQDFRIAELDFGLFQ